MFKLHNSFVLCILLLTLPYANGEEKLRPNLPGDNMSWLDNGVVKLGCDLNYGGAITWFSLSKGKNIVNNYDPGRQIQMAFYSGPKPFQNPAKHWAHLGWNPIQAGDDFFNGSKITEHHNDGKTIKLTCIPLQWPLDNVPGECQFSAEISLHGASAVLNYTFQNNRSDKTQYSARHQELPAVYTNTPYQKVVSYTGSEPFSDKTITEIPAKRDGKWQYWTATEGWAALVNEANWGLGVWSPTKKHFIGGAAGQTGKEVDCGYLAPLATEIIDHDIHYTYSCDIVLGSVEEIRAHAERRSRKQPALPHWDFSKTRQGWSTLNGTDGGWPLKGGLDIPEPRVLLSPITFWPAEKPLQVRLTTEAPIAGTCRMYRRILGTKTFEPTPILSQKLNNILIFELEPSQAPGTQLKLQIPEKCIVKSIQILHPGG